MRTNIKLDPKKRDHTPTSAKTHTNMTKIAAFPHYTDLRGCFKDGELLIEVLI
jgi:hypothetical protein